MTKRFFTTLMMSMMLAAAIPFMTSTASAQIGNITIPNYGQGRPNVYDRHRKAINIGVATGTGAVVGALFGGKKGALIGAAGGVAAGAIITKIQRPRNYSRLGYYLPF